MNPLQASLFRIFRTSVLLTSISASLVKAQQMTLPVGVESLTIRDGFNYLGLRLHENPVFEGQVTNITLGSSTVGVVEGVADSLQAGVSYLFEVDEGTAVGAVLEITSFDGVTNTITLSDDVSSDLAITDSVTIRPASTLASIFGINNSASLDPGFGGSGGADQVWVPDGQGGFHKYIYDLFCVDTFLPGWLDLSTYTTIDPKTVPIIYTDGIIILGDSGANSFTVRGVLKKSPVLYTLRAGFNYLSSVFPAGSTLESMFGANNSAGLDHGNGGPTGADSIYLQNSSGTLDSYYYDNFSPIIFAPSWSSAQDNSVIDPSTITLDANSGLIILNNGGPDSVVGSSPSFYQDL